MIHLVGRNVRSGWLSPETFQVALVGLHVNCEGKLKLTITTLLLLSNRGTEGHHTPLSIITKYTIYNTILSIYIKNVTKPVYILILKHQSVCLVITGRKIYKHLTVVQCSMFMSLKYLDIV